MATDYNLIREICISYSRISGVLIDEKMMYYADEKENLAKKINAKLKHYQHVTNSWPASYINFTIAQLIIHQVFKRAGLIQKFMNHAFVKSLSEADQEFLKEHQKKAWQYVFARITSTPSADFYEMEDVLSEKLFLFYSPSLKDMLKESAPTLWLLLIGFNGYCWQSFGLNIPLANVTPDDIFYFATEINPRIEDEDDIIDDIDTNPIPYLMLLNLGISPVILHKGHKLSHWSAEDQVINYHFDSLKIKQSFFIAWNKDVFELKLKRYNEFPHYAVAYYDESNNILFRYAATEHGFSKLTQALNKTGLNLFDEAEINVSFHMHLLLESILKKEIVINPYSSMFERADDQFLSDKEDDEEEEEMINLRKFMDVSVSKFNNNEPVDVDSIAKQFGADIEMARRVWKSFSDTVKRKK